MDMNVEIIEINKDNISDYLKLDIVAFHWAAGGACGVPGEVVFITRDTRVFETNYVYPVFGITKEDLFRIFPPLSEFHPGLLGGGYYPPSWKDEYLGLGNYLVVHESIWEDFSRTAREELTERNARGESVILYNIWGEIIINVLNRNKTLETNE